MARETKIQPGDKYGRLTVLERAPNRGIRVYWKCVCECGAEREFGAGNLTRTTEPTKSCGCLSAENTSASKKTHGMSKSTEFHIWGGMRARCNNPKSAGYSKYGARGITCDPAWDTFEQFYADMGPRLKGTTLDRIDNDAGYSKENCRWATYREQANNRSNTITLSYNGDTRTLAEWARHLGVKHGTLMRRYLQGATPEEILAIPVAARAPRNTPLTHNGETMLVQDWTRKLGFSRGLIEHRLDAGFSVEKALTTPPRVYKHK